MGISSLGNRPRKLQTRQMIQMSTHPARISPDGVQTTDSVLPECACADSDEVTPLASYGFLSFSSHSITSMATDRRTIGSASGHHNYSQTETPR